MLITKPTSAVTTRKHPLLPLTHPLWAQHVLCSSLISCHVGPGCSSDCCFASCHSVRSRVTKSASSRVVSESHPDKKFSCLDGQRGTQTFKGGHAPLNDVCTISYLAVQCRLALVRSFDTLLCDLNTIQGSIICCKC